MATVAGQVGARRASLAPDTYERVLSVGAVLLLLAMATALARGHAAWGRVPPFVWVHLITVALALGLTPYMLLRPRGSRRHRLLGRVWIVAMLATALATLFVQESRPGHYSWIHVFTAWTLLAAPYAWWTARTHRVEAHRGSVRGLVTGALLIAGFFTLIPGRMMGNWLLG